MKQICLMMMIIMLNSLHCETLFEIKDSSNQKVFDVSTDGIRVMNLGDTLMVISANSISASIKEGDKKGLSRTFSITTPSSVKGINEEVFTISPEAIPSVVDKNTMLWYPQKNAFRVGKVLILHPDSVGTNSFASGFNPQAKGDYSQAMGFESKANGTYAMAIGQGTKAMGISSLAMGQFASALGQSSIALGNSAATNFGSVAAGYNSNASGQNAVAIGYIAHASGSESVCLGQNSYANAYRSFAFGNSAKAEGLYSVAFGQDIEAQSYYSAVFGRFNIIEGSTNTWTLTDPIFVVGNGVPGARSNAMTLLKNGNLGLGTNLPGSYRLKAVNDASGVSGAAGYFENTNSSGIGLMAYATSTDVAFLAEQKNTSSTTANIAKFASMYGGSWSEKMTIRSTGRIYTPNLATGTGTALYLTTGGEIVKYSSSMKYKKEIEPLSFNLDKFMQLEPVRFKWNEKTATENKSDFGLIAEDVEKIDKDLAVYDQSGKIEGVDYQKINIMLLKVVQEQQQRIEQLEKRLNVLEKK